MRRREEGEDERRAEVVHGLMKLEGWYIVGGWGRWRGTGGRRNGRIGRRGRGEPQSEGIWGRS